MRSGVVYRIRCSRGQAYIGKTKRNLEACVTDHQAASRQGEIEKSAIVEHAWEEQHHPIRDNIFMLDQARNSFFSHIVLNILRMVEYQIHWYKQ